MADIIEKLKKFCDPEYQDITGFTSNPFSSQTRTYATDNRMCVSIDGVFAKMQIQYAEKCESVISKSKQTGDKVQLRADDLRGLVVKCDKCNEHGKRRIIDCPECDGEGVIYWQNDYHEYSAECKSCEGKGETYNEEQFYPIESCPNCHGTQLKPIYDRHGNKEFLFRIGPSYINPSYLLKILNEFPLIWLIVPDNNTAPVFFTFEGGHGIIMPMAV